MIRVAINGFGRIGRTTLRAGWDRKELQFVAINDLTEPKVLASLLQHDSVFGAWEHKVDADKYNLIINKKKIPVYAEKDPSLIPWKKNKVDVVIESTGFFTELAGAKKHIEAGAKRVVISAPSDDAPTYLIGVNHTKLKKSESIINNASCTTNSVAPVVQIMSETLGVKKAMLTTIHSVTAGQNIVDGLPSRESNDLRRGRSAMINIVPTSTGAAKATTKVITELENKFDGISIRVPTIDVSLSDITFLMKKKTTVEEVNNIFKKAAKSSRWNGILGVTDEPLVSSDFIKSSYGSVVDLAMTRVVDGDFVKVLAWYDNEWGYSMRLLDMVAYIGK